MNIDSAIHHLFTRLQSKRPIIVNTKDKVAFNAIIEHLNTKYDHEFSNNLHFANLYAHSLGQLIEKYQTTIDNPIPHKKLHKLMDSPFNNIVEDITYRMNNRLLCSIFKDAGCNLDKHPAITTKEKKELVLNNLKELLSISSNQKILLGEIWSEDEVAKGIKSQLKQFY